ncbi:MAG: histidinol-phosphatase [Pseudomonadota bacterium]
MADDIDSFLATAERLADTAGAIVRRYFRTPIRVVDKSDRTPVTVADREAEAAMRTIIERSFPAHSVIGEEHGPSNPGASHVWVLDPIDGTKSFITGRPLFGTLVALCRDGRPILGVIDCPALGERWVGRAGRPTTHQGQPVRTRPCPALVQAALYCVSPLVFSAPDFERFERVRRAVRTPVYGGDCYSYGLVASGFADLVVEAGLKAHDWAAIVPVIEGAGGRMTDWRGRPLELAADGHVLAAGDARAHAEAMALLAD